MAKNEKNKDEVQINTLFGDVYQVTRHIGAPRAFTFVIKRSMFDFRGGIATKRSVGKQLGLADTCSGT
jgi:hypothetical protein